MQTALFPPLLMYYIGQYDSEEDYAEEYIRETQDLSDFVLQYFNYAQYATDLFCSGYWFKRWFRFLSLLITNWVEQSTHNTLRQ